MITIKKKIFKIILGSSSGLVVIGIIILIPILMIMDFFGANITDGYVENNMEYADKYISTLNNNIANGYVSLERILYFYLEKDSLSFDEIYKDNLDIKIKRMKPISDVCLLSKYLYFDVCKKSKINSSGQIDDIQNKPFQSPINISSSSITSFFMQERIIYETYGVHKAIDFGAPAQTPLYAVADCIVAKVSFPYSQNIIDKSGSGGNNISLECKVDNLTYTVRYMHLYPNSAKVKINDFVKQGTQIASVGTTGYSTGNHLHYQVELDGKTIDGLSLIDFSIITGIPQINNNLPKRDYSMSLLNVELTRKKKTKGTHLLKNGDTFCKCKISLGALHLPNLQGNISVVLPSSYPALY